MNDLLPIVVLFSIVMTCIIAWRLYPSFRCAAIAAGFVIVALPFYVPSLDRMPHGHPDLRGAFLVLFAMPLLLMSSVVSCVGLCSRRQQRVACGVVLLIALVAFLFGFALAEAPR